MAIAFRAASAVAAGTTDLSMAMPTGTVEHDFMVMAICFHDTASNPTLPGGWTVIDGPVTFKSSLGSCVVATKRAANGEAGPYAVSGMADSCCGVVASFSGVRRSPDDGIDSYSFRANAAGASGTLGISTSEANCMIVQVACVMDNLALSGWTDTNAGTTYVERADGRTPNGSDTGIGVATALLATAGATGATSYTVASPTFQNIGGVISLLPLIAQTIPDNGVPNATHAHTSDQLPLMVENSDLVTSDAVHAHSTDNVALDVMLEVANCTHAHDATAPTIVHNIVAALYTHVFFWAIALPAIGGIPGPKIPHGCSATELSSYVVETGKTVTFNIEERTDQDSAGTDLLAADQVADDNGATTGTFANKYLAKDNFLWVDITAVDAGALTLAITLACTDETDLVLANAQHGHNADNVALTQEHSLEVQDATHAHDADNISLAQAEPEMVVASSTHAHTASVPTLIEDVASTGEVMGFWCWAIESPAVGGIPGPKTPVHGRFVDLQSYVTAATSVTYNIEVRETSLASGSDILVADQVAVTTGAQNTLFTEPVFAKDKFLWLDIQAVADTPEFLMVTLTYAVSALQAVDDCTHAHTADNVALDVMLEVSDCTHAHDADKLSVSTDEGELGYNIFGFYTWTVENPQVGVIPGPKVPDDIELEEISSYVTLGTSATFNVESRGDHALPGVNALAADQVAITTGASTEDIANYYVTKDRWLCLDISAVSWLDQADPPLTASILTVTVAWEYNAGGVANCTHAHTADNVDLVVNEDILLLVDSPVHGHAADTPVLTERLRRTVDVELIVTPVMLVVADCTHAHTADNATLTGITMIYLPSSGTPTVSPDYDGAAFDDINEADRIVAVFEKGTTARTEKTSIVQNYSTTTSLIRQYVLGDVKGLAAHDFTTSEAFTLVVQCEESNALANATLKINMNLYDIGGTGTYGNIYSGIVNASEFAVLTPTSRYCVKNFTSNVTMTGGSILVIEFGASCAVTDGEEYTLGIMFGDAPATALSLNDIDTGADYPYIQFPFAMDYWSTPLTVANCTHAHTADGDLAMDAGLGVDNATHAHDATNCDLYDTTSTLIVQNCTHAHTSENISFPAAPGRRLYVKVNGHWIKIAPEGT